MNNDQPQLFTGTKPMPTTCTIDANAAREAVSLCMMAVKPRSPQPSLLAVHVAAGPLGIEFRGSDLATTIGVGVASDGEFQGSVQGDLLQRAVNGVSDETIRLTRDGTRLAMRWGSKGKFDIAVGAFDMPPVEADDVAPIAVDGDALADAIKHATTATEAGKSTFSGGIQFSRRDGRLFVCGTDGRQVAIAKVPGIVGEGEPCVLTVEDAKRVAAVVGGGSAEIKMTSRRMHAAGGSRWISATAMEVRYPPVFNIVAGLGQLDAAVTVNRGLFLARVQSVGVVLADDPQTLSVTLRVAGGRYELAASSAKNGDACEGGELAEASDAEAVAVVGHTRLLDAVRSSPSDRVTIGFQNELGKPLRINEGSDAETYIVPMNLTPIPASA